MADGKYYEIEYIDKRPIVVTELTYYRDVIKLPDKNGNNIIKVTENEKNSLLKLKNGNRQVFVEVKRYPKKEQHKKEEKVILEKEEVE